MYFFVRIEVREVRLGVEEARDVGPDTKGANAGAYNSGIEVVVRRDGAMKTRYRAREVPEMCVGGISDAVLKTDAATNKKEKEKLPIMV